jgi:mannose-6-phosphate isomerase-like protein (cupin superfamily)
MQDYDIHLDVRFAATERFDVAELGAAHEPWFNQTLCAINDSVLRLGVLEGDFHWHKHDAEDELFYVVSGRLIIDLEGERQIDLGPCQGAVVPRGMMHRPRAVERTVVLMVERDTVTPSGD